MTAVCLNSLLDNPKLIRLKTILGVEADLHLVGGAVRDFLSKTVSKDLDLATKLTPTEMIDKFNKNDLRWIPTGIRRGTITVLVEEEAIEITTFRNPAKEDVFTKSIHEDLPSRDFTINAIAISLNSECIIDPFGGIKDLEEGIVRTVGNAKDRFLEDPHRILRMVRFGTACGRKIEKNTLEAGKNLSQLLSVVSLERVNAELTKILCSPNAALAFKKLHELKILQQVLPELVACMGISQNKYHIFDVFDHTMAVVDNCPRERILRLAALFHDIGKPCVLSYSPSGTRQFLQHEKSSVRIAKEVMKRLKYSNKDITQVSLLVETHMKRLQMQRRGVRRLIQKLGDSLDSWIILKKADIFGGRVISYDLEKAWSNLLTLIEEERGLKQVSKYDCLAINGRDVMNLGIKQGPIVGNILNHLKELALDAPSVNTKAVLIKKAKNYLKENNYASGE